MLQVRSVSNSYAGKAAAPRLLWVILLMVAAGLLFWLLHRRDFGDFWLEDLPVYSRAVHEWLAGRNPYNASQAPLYFLYPPFFLYVAGLASHLLPAHWGEIAYVALSIVATCAIPLVLAKYYFRQPWLGPLFAFLLFFASPRFTGLLALCGMNVASSLYLLAFVAAIPGLRRNLWTWFYLAVIFAAMIKITFLALLLLPLLAGRRQWARSVSCGFLVITLNIAERLLIPQMYAGYQWALQQGILAQQNYGYGIFGIMAQYHHTRNPKVGPGPYIVSILISLALVTLMLLLRRRLDRSLDRCLDRSLDRSFDRSIDMTVEAPWRGVWLALILVTIVLVNPREMQYDVDIAVFAAFLLWMYALEVSEPLLLMVLLFLPSLAVPFVLQNIRLHGTWETFVAFAGFILAYRKLWRQSDAAGALTPDVGTVSPASAQ